MITTRRATLHDIQALLQFEQAIIETERAFDTTLQQGEIHYYDLRQLMVTPDAEVIVAIDADTVIGCGYAKIKAADSFLQHSVYAHLGCMYVLPAYRGQGVNQLVLDALIHWCKQQNIDEVRLEVYNDNTAAKHAYIKAGFVPNLVEMRRKV